MGAGGEATLTLEAGAGLIGRVLEVGAAGTGDFTSKGIGLFYGSARVGQAGAGTLTLSDGKDSSIDVIDVGQETGASGIVGVLGDSTRLLFETAAFGIVGSGLLLLNSGGGATGRRLDLGLAQASSGTLQVSGGDSDLSVKALLAGGSGEGLVQVSDSGLVSTDTLLIGLGATGSGDVRIERKGGLLASRVFAGAGGRGGVILLDGGSALTREVVVGVQAGSIGSLTVDGDSSEWIALGSVRIGGEGLAFGRLTNGGSLTVDRTLFVGPLGSMDISNGNVDLGGLRVASGGTLIDTTGVLNVGPVTSKQRATATTDSLILAEGAIFDVREVVFGEGAYLGGGGAFAFTYTNSGGLNPGDAPDRAGAMTLAGYTQTPSGKLEIELGPEATDHLTVEGEAALAGIVEVRALEGFPGRSGDEIEILRASRITGAFDEVAMLNIGVEAFYTDTTVTLRITSPVGIEEETASLPTRHQLLANYPNPFNRRTIIPYELAEATHVRMVVYDALGREVERLVDGMREAGRHEAAFEAGGLPSGVYFYRLEARSLPTETRQMTRLR